MEAKFSPRVKDVITFSREEALRLGHEYIGVEHLLLGIIREGEGVAVKIMKESGIDMKELRKEVEGAVQSSSGKSVNLGNIPLVKQAEKVLKITYLEAKLYKSSMIGTEHLLLSILKDDDNIATQTLNKFNLNYDKVKDELEHMSRESEEDFRAEFPGSTADDEGEDDAYDSGGSGGGSQRKSESKSKTPVLDNFGRDLTRMAEEEKLDPIVGRDYEIERVSQILSRRKKNNPILIGEPGVGKSAIAEGLALRIFPNPAAPLSSFNQALKRFASQDP